MYITEIKDFFKQTNIRKSYKKQILNYNIEKFILMVRNNLDIFFFAKTLTQTDQDATLQVNSIKSAKKIMEDWKQYFEKNKC